MQTQASAGTRGIVVAHGYGIKIRVDRGHLIIEDGIGRDRSTHRYNRAGSGLKRLVVIGHTGYITLEALRWLHDIGAALLHVDADGQLLTISTTGGPSPAALRRAQALAVTNQTGVGIARELLRDKVAGQAALLSDLPDGYEARPQVEHALSEIESAQNLAALVVCESRAAFAYWSAWRDLPVAIAARRNHARGIPDHWRTFGQRYSLITHETRTATNPPNAVLNYLYALLEAETILGCHRVGLDPGLGIFHTDKRDRASLALDVMEAVRPAVDGYVLELFAKRTLSTDDFGETRQGACRLSVRMAASLVDTVGAWRNHVAPHIERVAHTLAGSVGSSGEVRTPLTRATAIAAWDKRKPDRRRKQARSATLKLPHTCRNCGEELQNARNRYCGKCHVARSSKQTAAAQERAAQTLNDLRAARLAGGPATSRGIQNAAHQRAAKEWAGELPDPAIFTVQILPGLREVPLSVLAAATGLSEHYCSMIRLGKRVPHPRHWETLRVLAREPAP